MSETKTSASQVGRETTDRVREAVNANPMTSKAKDAAFTVVGLGVMGAQRMSVATRHLSQYLANDDRRRTQIRINSDDAKVAMRQRLMLADQALTGALA